MLSMSRHPIRPYLEDHGCTKNCVVPSTLHQCLKYVKDGQQYQVGGEIKPFGIHEIKHCDAKYYLNSGDSPDSDEAKIQPQRRTREMYRIGAVIKNLMNMLKRSRRSTPMININAPLQSLMIVTVPEGHIKDLPPAKRVAELETFFIPPTIKHKDGRRVVHRGILFYKSAISRKWCNQRWLMKRPDASQYLCWTTVKKACSSSSKRWVA